MARDREQHWSGYRCPANPAHGQLLLMNNGRLWCPSNEHDGLPRAHPDGPTPRTKAWFNEAEVRPR